MKYCCKSWGSLSTGWTYCTREYGHEGVCINEVLGPKQPDDKYWEEQPDAIAFNQKQVENEQKKIAKSDVDLY